RRRHLRPRDDQRDRASRLVQAHRAPRVPHGAHPPPLRAQGLGRAEGHRPVLDHQHHARPRRPGDAETPVTFSLPRHALVIGMGKSGIAATRLLRDLGAAVRVYDRNARIESLPEGVESFLGAAEPPPEAVTGIDALILSPGVPPQTIVQRCRERAPTAAIHGELGLALQLLPATPPRLSLITGTNGKSTVTALLGALLRAAGRDVFVGGNLGDPVAERVRLSACEGHPWPTDLVLECSSF